MYTLIIYENGKCISTLSELENPVVEDTTVTWEDGQIKGINKDFIVVEGNLDVEEGADISSLILADKKESLISYEKKKEKDSEVMQSMINTIMLDPTNIDQQKQLEQMQSMINNMMLGGM